MNTTRNNPLVYPNGLTDGDLGWYLVERTDGGAEVLQFTVGKSPADNWCHGQYGGVYSGSQGPFLTYEEALAKTAYEGGPAGQVCSHCGYLIKFGYTHWKELLERHACFNCNFWLNRIRDAKADDTLIIGGSIFHDGGRSADPNRSFLGFGGREFTILHNDGRVIRTNNLWSGGSHIPDRWRPQLPDNARFADNIKWVECADGTWCLG